MKKTAMLLLILLILPPVSAWSNSWSIKVPKGHILEHLKVNYTSNCSGQALLILKWSTGSEVEALPLPEGTFELNPQVGGNVSLILKTPCRLDVNLTPVFHMSPRVAPGRMYVWKKRLVSLHPNKKGSVFTVFSPWKVVAIYVVTSLLIDNRTHASSAELSVELMLKNETLNFNPKYIGEGSWLIDTRSINLSGNFTLRVRGWKDVDVYVYAIAPIEESKGKRYIVIFKNFTALFGYWDAFKRVTINLEFFYTEGDVLLLNFYGNPGDKEMKLYLKDGRICLMKGYSKECHGEILPGPQRLEISFTGGYLIVSRRNFPGDNCYFDVFTGFDSITPYILLKGINEEDVYAVDIYVSNPDFLKPEKKDYKCLAALLLSSASMVGLIILKLMNRR